MIGRLWIFLIGGGEDEEAMFTLDEVGEACRVVCDYRGKSVAAEASDFFDALCKVRRLLWEERLIPFCYGASLNVFPSGMGRDMGRGLKAYRLTKGQQARMEDLVDIFDSGPDVIPATVELQEEFWRDWLESPKS